MNILKFLAESLSIEIIEDKNKLKDSIVKYIENMNTEDADKFEKMIEDQLDEAKTPINTDNENNDILKNILNKKPKKRAFLEVQQTNKIENKEKKIIIKKK